MKWWTPCHFFPFFSNTMQAISCFFTTETLLISTSKAWVLLFPQAPSSPKCNTSGATLSQLLSSRYLSGFVVTELILEEHKPASLPVLQMWGESVTSYDLTYNFKSHMTVYNQDLPFYADQALSSILPWMQSTRGIQQKAQYTRLASLFIHYYCMQA